MRWNIIFFKLHTLTLISSLNEENAWWHLLGYCRLSILDAAEAAWDYLGTLPVFRIICTMLQSFLDKFLSVLMVGFIYSSIWVITFNNFWRNLIFKFYSKNKLSLVIMFFILLFFWDFNLILFLPYLPFLLTLSHTSSSSPSNWWLI